MTRFSSNPLAVVLIVSLMTATTAAAIPRPGDRAPDFTLKTPAGEPVHLASLVEKSPVVLVVLRGWPGYQCPACTAQVGELIRKSKELSGAKAQVVLVYPGPSDGLKAHAEDFARGKALPDNFHFVLDPDYMVTNQYDVRWNAAGETAYPSTFVLDPHGKVVYAKTSRTHAGRAKASEVLGALGGH